MYNQKQINNKIKKNKKKEKEKRTKTKQMLYFGSLLLLRIRGLYLPSLFCSLAGQELV